VAPSRMSLSAWVAEATILLIMFLPAVGCVESLVGFDCFVF
jgi:hypothetical protein